MASDRRLSSRRTDLLLHRDFLPWLISHVRMTINSITEDRLLIAKCPHCHRHSHTSPSERSCGAVKALELQLCDAAVSCDPCYFG